MRKSQRKQQKKSRNNRAVVVEEEENKQKRKKQKRTPSLPRDPEKRRGERIKTRERVCKTTID